ncbi:hypothetical protein Tco_1427778 [Tanacetum coccineum]
MVVKVVRLTILADKTLEYLKGGSLSSKYKTSTTKTKDAKYDTIEGIEDMVPSLWSLVKKKLSNMERDDLFDLNVALWMFTRRVVILKRVEDLQLGVESYQKKLNITRPKIFRWLGLGIHSHDPARTGGDLPRDIPLVRIEVLRLTISPNVEVSFFKLLRTTDDIEDMTFDVYALPCYGLVLFVMALFIHAL